MISEKLYLKNPCRYSSLPYYKLKTIRMPDHIKVIHRDDFDFTCSSEPYFRMIHYLNDLVFLRTPTGYSLEVLDVTKEENLKALSVMISKCYAHETLPVDQMKSMMEKETFDKNLWIMIKKDNEIVASAISEFDPSLKEGALEWIQVLPEHKNKGLGTLLVNTSLMTLSKKAKFVTVSGRVNNGDHPMDLYKKCGFEGSDIWHFINSKKENS